MATAAHPKREAEANAADSSPTFHRSRMSHAMADIQIATPIAPRAMIERAFEHQYPTYNGPMTYANSPSYSPLPHPTMYQSRAEIPTVQQYTPAPYLPKHARHTPQISQTLSSDSTYAPSSYRQRATALSGYAISPSYAVSAKKLEPKPTATYDTSNYKPRCQPLKTPRVGATLGDYIVANTKGEGKEKGKRKAKREKEKEKGLLEGEGKEGEVGTRASGLNVAADRLEDVFTAADKGKGKMKDGEEGFMVMGAKTEKTQRANDDAEGIACAKIQQLEERERAALQDDLIDLDEANVNFKQQLMQGLMPVNDEESLNTNAYSRFDASAMSPETKSPAVSTASKRPNKAGNSKQYYSERTSVSQQFKRLHELGKHNMVATSPYFPKTPADLAIHEKEYAAGTLEAKTKKMKADIERRHAESEGKVFEAGPAFHGKTFVHPGSAVLGLRTIWTPAMDDDKDMGSAALEGSDIPEEVQKDIARRQVLILWPGLSELKVYGDLPAERGARRVFPLPRYAETISVDHAMFLFNQGYDQGHILSLFQAGPLPRDIPWEYRQLVEPFGLDEVDGARHDLERVRQGVASHLMGGEASRYLFWSDVATLVGECDVYDGGSCGMGYNHVWEVETYEKYGDTISEMATNQYFQRGTREVDEEVLRAKGGWDGFLNEMDGVGQDVDAYEEGDRISAWIGEGEGWWIRTECVATEQRS